MATATVWCWLVKIKSNVRLQKSATNQLVIILCEPAGGAVGSSSIDIRTTFTPSVSARTSKFAEVLTRLALTLFFRQPGPCPLVVVLLLDLFSIACSGGKAFKPHFPSRCVELVRFSPQVPHVPGRSGLAEQVRPCLLYTS